jgi:hypothetical protein
MGKNIMASLLLPSLNVLDRDVAGHVYMAAVTAPTADNIFILFAVHY